MLHKISLPGQRLSLQNLFDKLYRLISIGFDKTCIGNTKIVSHLASAISAEPHILTRDQSTLARPLQILLVAHHTN
jgi:hypothetical protein